MVSTAIKLQASECTAPVHPVLLVENQKEMLRTTAIVAIYIFLLQHDLICRERRIDINDMFEGGGGAKEGDVVRGIGFQSS